jgi:hypothetical protein
MLIADLDFGVGCKENGKGVTIYDYTNDQLWALSDGGAVFSCERDTEEGRFNYEPLCPVKAILSEENSISITYKGAWDKQTYSLGIQYKLRKDYVEITLMGGLPKEIQAVSLPGSFIAAGSSVSKQKNIEKYLMPIMQGMYWDGRGGDFDWQLQEATHGGFGMPMYGLIGDTGGLLAIAENNNDVLWRVGKLNGKPYLSNIQRASLGRIGGERKMRLYFTKPDITAIAKRYRAYVKARGLFIGWDEKLHARPELGRLFGTVFGFTGYCRDDADYAAECAKLKGLGFPNAHLFPVRFNTYSDDFLMGGFPPVNLDGGAIEKVKALGYDAAPWSWIGEAMDDGGADIRGRYRIYHDGNTRLTWQIDNFKWYKTCNSTLPDYQQNALNGVCSDLTWDHFDVITCHCNHECYAQDHPNHLGRPMGRAEDREWLRRLLLAARAGARPVSSESFNDAYSLEYDIGSVLAWPQYGPWDFWPVPLTMLVYHDSMIHTWWEAHAYNDNHFGRDCVKYQYGGGRPELMSSMDALYGNPPFIFPFGAQYAWTGDGKETFLYKYRLEDPITQIAVERAREVANLHRRIGKAELLEFRFVTADGYVQKTSFEGGVDVYANFGPHTHYIPNAGTLGGASWITTGA